MSLVFRLWMWILFLSYGPSRISVECSDCLPSPSALEGRESSTVFPVLGNCWHLLSAFPGFQLLLSTEFLAFPPSTCAVQEPAKDLRVCKQISGLQTVAPFSMAFPCSVLSLSQRPGFWFWLSGQQDGPFAWESPPGPWALGRALSHGDVNTCVFLLRGVNSLWFWLVVPLQWFYILSRICHCYWQEG